jgi:protein MBA1
MRKLAQENAFPGRDISSARSFQIFQAKSTEDSAWVAPLRATLLENYNRVNNAIAEWIQSHFQFVLTSTYSVPRGDSKKLTSLTTHEFAKSASRRLRNLHPAGKPAAYKWRLVSQPSPVRIVSVRALEGHFGLQPIRTGNPLYVNVLARFDTIQALTRRGVASTVEPKRIVEYLLFEKRMWYDTPWIIKEQLHVNR